MATEIIFLFNHRWLVFSKTSENTRPDAAAHLYLQARLWDAGRQATIGRSISNELLLVDDWINIYAKMVWIW